MVVIDLFIVCFACASIIAFVATKDLNEHEKGCKPEQCEEVEKKEIEE